MTKRFLLQIVLIVTVLFRVGVSKAFALETLEGVWADWETQFNGDVSWDGVTESDLKTWYDSHYTKLDGVDMPGNSYEAWKEYMLAKGGGSSPVGNMAWPLVLLLVCYAGCALALSRPRRFSAHRGHE